MSKTFNWTLRPLFLALLMCCRFMLAKDCHDLEITTLTETVCDLLLAGNSIDEIVNILDETQNLHDSKTLVSAIYETLSMQTSKQDAVIAIANNKKLKKLYKRKSLWQTIKKTYAMLSMLKIILYLLLIITIVVLCAIACYLLYKYVDFSKLLKWLAHFFKEPQPANTGPQSSFVDQTEILQPAAEPSKTTQILDITAQKAATTQPYQAPINEIKPQETTNCNNEFVTVQIPNVSKQETRDAPLKSGQGQIKLTTRTVNSMDIGLITLISQQIAYAKSIGLEPAQFVVFPTAEKTTGPRKKFKELISQQMEYAKGIGLIPFLNNEEH